MSIFMGYISLICLLLLAGKFVARKTNSHKIDCFFKKLHKPVSCVFLLFCVAHLFLAFPILKGRDLMVTVSGSISLGIAILLILLCHLIQDVKRKMLWHRILTIALLAAVVLHIVVYFNDYMRYKDKVREIKISDVNIAAIPDGKYIGEYDVGYIYVKVQVVIQDGKFSKIDILEHRNERGQKAEAIVDNIIEEQKIDVDAVTSATNSSLVIEKACENALSQEKGIP